VGRIAEGPARPYQAPVVYTPLFWAAAVAAAAAIGLSKGGLGPLGGLAVPILSFVISPVEAAGLTLPIFVMSDVVAVIAYRRSFDPGLLKVMLPAALVGIGLGWMTAAQVSDDAVRLIVGVVSAAFAMNYWLRRGQNQEPSRPSTPKGSAWGAVAGYTSFVSHSGGAPFQMYVLPLGLTPVMFAGTSTIFFASVNAAKLIPYYFLGQLRPTNLLATIILASVSILCALAAVRLVKVIDQRLFYRIIYVLMFAIGLLLIGQAAGDIL
jgi:uncharacterized membrane protein YfcA